MQTTEYRLIRSSRRTVSLSVTKEAEVVVRAPLKMPLREIDSFVNKHLDWIEKHRARIEERTEAEKAVLSDSQVSRLKQKAKEYLPQRTEQISKLMGVVPKSIKITSAATRWGSCSGKNGICFSYRVMLLPDELIDYIIVHELAHIRVKNHGPRFYHEMEKYMPDCRERRKKIRRLNIDRKYLEFMTKTD